MLKINEMFPAIQGEGSTSGKPVYFIRLSGCNAECDFCDTKYHRYGKNISNREVIKSINKSELKNIVITGGEPLLQMDDVSELMLSLPNKRFYLETNGSLYHQAVGNFKKISCSPKKELIRNNIESYHKFNTLKQTTFKFVYEHEYNYWWMNFIDKLKIENDRVWIMPEGATKKKQLEKMPEVINYCLKNKFNFSPRLHVLAFDTKRKV